MPSIKDAFEEAIQDDNSIIKYFVFAIPVFICTVLYTNKNTLSAFWTASIVTFLLLFGFLIECTKNVRNGKEYVLPSFNVFSIMWAGIKGSVALGPLIAVNCWLAITIINFLGNYIPDPNTITVFKYMIWGVFGAIMLTGYLCYAKTFKIIDAYNFKTISDSSMDILIAVIFMIPQVLIADAIILVPITYIIWVFFGIPHPIATFFWSMVLIFNLAMCGHYLAQIDYEAIATKDNDNKII